MCTAHAARLAFEIGCDVAKVSWKGDENSLIAVRKAVPIPILITPGTGITSDLELLKLVQKGMELEQMEFAWGDQYLDTILLKHCNCSQINRA